MIADAYKPTDMVSISKINQNPIDIKKPFCSVFIFLLEYVLWKILGSIKVIIDIKDQDRIYPIGKWPVIVRFLSGTFFRRYSIPPKL